MLIPFADTVREGDAGRRMDTLVAHNGSFSYTPSVSGPALVVCIPQKAFYKRHGGGLYLPPAKIMELVVSPTDNLDAWGRLEDDGIRYSVSGSPIDAALATGRATYISQDVLVAQLEEQLDSLRTILSDTAILNRVFRARVTVSSAVTDLKMAFVRAHPDSELSAYYLCFSSIPPDAFAQAYPGLSERIRRGLFKGPLAVGYKNYQQYIATKQAADSAVIGRTAPEFSLRTAAGDTFALRRARGYVVLDFWGTWCGWCMQEMPTLRAAYHQYGASVTFVGIACNDDAVKWRQTIARDSLDWTQVLDGPAANVAVRYGVKAYPTKVILDGNGKIVGKYIGADEAFYTKLAALASEP
jgi:thiol-disulfide isomerase/thioredoxin